MLSYTLYLISHPLLSYILYLKGNNPFAALSAGESTQRNEPKPRKNLAKAKQATKGNIISYNSSYVSHHWESIAHIFSVIGALFGGEIQTSYILYHL